ncbi:MAG TPA: alkaline phosphatase D family protein [Jiangellaceae bacterium]
MAEPGLVLGPIVRAVDRDQATVWVETDSPCEVAVGSHVAQTVTFMEHHYAFVDVGGLGEAAEPYTVTLDGRQVWPINGQFPPSVLRALPREHLKALFGSCRTILPDEDGDPDRIDALREFAWRAANAHPEELPDALILLGDQVYADQGAPATRRFIRRHRRRTKPPSGQTHHFSEFVTLYREAWREPAVRWLLSTVSTLMIFDDHEIIDNWNASESWLAEHQSEPWWREHVRNGLAAYWMYQHLGNLSGKERESDPLFAALRRGDESVALSAFDKRATHGAEGTQAVRWSYARELGPAHLVMVDSRDGRVLSGGQRLMLDSDDAAWAEREVQKPAPYLLVGTSLPVLLPRGVHHIEHVVNAACEGRWGRVGSYIGEEIRQAAQLNHWVTFPDSFVRLLDMLRRAGDEVTRRGVIVLSGDVHLSYGARINAWQDGVAPVVPTYQLVGSPFCHDLDRTDASALRAAVSRPGAYVGRLLTKVAREPRPEVDWSINTGPWFNNVVGMLEFDADGATCRFERTRVGGPLGSRLELVDDRRLT